MEGQVAVLRPLQNRRAGQFRAVVSDDRQWFAAPCDDGIEFTARLCQMFRSFELTCRLSRASVRTARFMAAEDIKTVLVDSWRQQKLSAPLPNDVK
jgi:hypothetical protein